MPNGVFFQRGGWLAECRENKKRFLDNDSAAVVVFPSEAPVGGGGRAFWGIFISESGTRYDVKSPTLAVGCVSGRALLKRVEELLEKWNQPEALVRAAGSQAIWVVRARKSERS